MSPLAATLFGVGVAAGHSQLAAIAAHDHGKGIVDAPADWPGWPTLTTRDVDALAEERGEGRTYRHDLAGRNPHD